MADSTPRHIPAYSLFGQVAALLEPRFCHVERIGDRWRLHSGRIEVHSHPHLHQLSLWLAGSGHYVVDDATYPLLPGTVCWMPSGTPHGFRVVAGSEAVVLSMSDDFAREQIGMLSGTGLRVFHEHLVVRAGPEDRKAPWLAALFERMEYEYASPRAAQPDSMGALARLALIEAQRIAAVSDAITSDADAGLLLRFMRLVEERLGHRPGVRSIADELGTTPYLLNRVCQAGLGLRASELVRARHIQEAKRLLLFTALRVSQIGQALGYDDPAHFARSFRRATGKGPREWREERTGIGTIAETGAQPG